MGVCTTHKVHLRIAGKGRGRSDRFGNDSLESCGYKTLQR